MAARTSIHQSPKNPAFCAWLAAAGNRATTVRSYDYKVAAYLKWSDGRQSDTALLRAYSDYLRLERRLRPRTLEVVYAAIHSYCQYLKSTRQLRRVPDCHCLRPGRLDKVDRPVAYSEDLQLLWGAAWALPEYTLREQYVKYRALLCLAICCYVAARRSEVLDIDLPDVSQRQGEPWVLFLRQTKGGDSHWMPCHPDLQAILEKWLPIRQAWVEKCGHLSDALIPVDRVRRLGEAGLTEVFRMLGRRAGIAHRRLTPHSFRHWVATTIADQSGTRDAQAALGHKSPKTTELYLSQNPVRLQAAVNALPSFSQPPGSLAAVPSESWRQIL